MNVIVSVLFVAFFSFSGALEKDDAVLHFNKDKIRELILNYEKNINGLESKHAGEISAVINDFIDKIFNNARKIIIENGFDPMPMDDIDENFMLADLSLNRGQLHGLSTVSRYDDVIVSYQSQYKTLGIKFPLFFSNLSFTYDYSAKFMGLGPTGDMLGKVDNFKFYADLSFNFNTLTAAIEEIKTTNSGTCKVEFHGHLTDFFVNIFSKFATQILNPLIQGVLEGIVKKQADKVVSGVNDFIFNITHQ